MSSERSLIAEFGLSREFFLPLASQPSRTVDVLTGIVGALSTIAENEIGLLQIIFEPAQCPWAESIFRAITLVDGKALFGGPRELLAQAREKLGRPLYGVIVRVAAQSDDEDRAAEIVRGVASALTALDNPAGNTLFPLDNDEYEFSDHERDLLQRRSRRCGMLLNSEELISLVHVPTSAVQSAKLRRQDALTKAAPASTRSHQLVLGNNEHAGKTTVVSLSDDQRARHMHVVGASGTGKSTFLLNLILQDIRHGHGVAILDPHGDLIDTILNHCA